MNDTLSNLLKIQDTRTPMVDRVAQHHLICPKLDASQKPTEHHSLKGVAYCADPARQGNHTRRNLSDYQRGVLALRMKPIFEARALASYQANVGRPVKSSPISDAITPDIFTGEVQPVTPVKAPAPIRTDTAVASLANLGKDTIRKIERMVDC